MSLKSKLFASAAALTMVSGVGLAGALTAGTASAETPSCGPTCIDFFNYGPGSSLFNPSYLLDSYKQEQATGSPLILFATNNTDPAQDFAIGAPEPLSDYYQAGLVSSLVALHYGCVPNVNFAQCTGTGGIGVNDYAFEINYQPFGAPTGECVGVAATAVAGEKVTLQPCGVSGKTIWIFDTPCFSSVTDPSGETTSGSPGDICTEDSDGNPFADFYSFIKNTQFPLVNGSDTNFSQPFVMTYPNGASPLNTPRTSLEVTNLTTFANGLGFPNANINFNQEWGARIGEVAP